MSVDIFAKRLQTGFKLNGLTVRRDLCTLVVRELVLNDVDLVDRKILAEVVSSLSASLEKLTPAFRSIEEDIVQKAVQLYLNRNSDECEILFSVIDAFDFPKLMYDVDRKIYILSQDKPSFLSGPETKAELFAERYNTVLQRTRRSFSKKQIAGWSEEKLQLQTVDYLLTSSCMTLENTLVLGTLLQASEGKYLLEDTTGTVALDLQHATYHGGIFLESCVVLVSGIYEDKILRVSRMVLPPGENFNESRPSFGSINYFGGKSSALLRESEKLLEMQKNVENNIMLFFSDVWLDRPIVLEKLEVMFEGFKDVPPVAFVFMGNFLSESYGVEKTEILRNCFKKLANIIQQYSSLMTNSHFIFVPGMNDPTHQHIAPRAAIPKTITEDFTKLVPKAKFTTNPCRLQYYTREIAVFRSDVLVKMLQGALNKPEKARMGEALTRTVIAQGHLSPFTLNVQPVHWDWDYTLRLYPLPDLVVIGDRSEPYSGKYKNCTVANPGSFYTSGFSFKSYVPSIDVIDDCNL